MKIYQEEQSLVPASMMFLELKDDILGSLASLKMPWNLMFGCGGSYSTYPVKIFLILLIVSKALRVLVFEFVIKFLTALLV